MTPYSLLRGVGFVALYFYLLPGAFIVLNESLGWSRWQGPALDAVGTLVVAAALGLILYCSRLFWTLGRGTPVPTQPPATLVVTGLYRFSRHPIYIGYVGIGVGVFLIEGHLALLLYPLTLFALAQMYLVKIEEPSLVERFGEEYEEYRRRVPRWPRPRRSA